MTHNRKIVSIAAATLAAFSGTAVYAQADKLQSGGLVTIMYEGG